MVSIPMQTTHPISLTDEDLASQALADPQAFAELYQRYIQNVYRFHYAQCSSVHEAEDLTTITFLAALEGLHKYKGTGKFVSWLFGIARNQRLMYQRSLRSERPLDDALEITGSEPHPETLAAQNLEIARVKHALKLLSKDRREVVLLCLFADLTAEDAGLILGKSPAAIKMQLMRGLRELRGYLSVADED